MKTRWDRKSRATHKQTRVCQAQHSTADDPGERDREDKEEETKDRQAGAKCQGDC